MTDVAVDAGAATGALSLDEEIGERVHSLMWRKRITQVQLAKCMGTSQGAVSRKLRGERPWFASELLAASDALGVSMKFLVGRPDDDDLPPGHVCAARESNPQPAGSEPRAAAGDVVDLFPARRAEPLEVAA